MTFNQGVDILGKKCLISQNLPVDILGITFNQGVDILGKKCLISQNLPVDILG
jgi:antitoxin component of RelBE/YafQ-DinJ toxin-antitoxin module